MTILLAVSLFFCEPILPDLPRASAFIEEDESGAVRLVDRYSVFDLWTAQRVCGRWQDSDGRQFLLAVLDARIPADLDGPPESRVEFEAEKSEFERDDVQERMRAIQALVPYPVAVDPDDWTKPHQLPRTCRDIRYCEGTNEHLIVAMYLPEKSERWQLAVWELAETDDVEEFRLTFEDEFLRRRAWTGMVPDEPVRRRGDRAPRKARPLSERELLRRDLVHSVTNYPRWRVTDSPGYAILDELEGHADFIARLTNELVAVRADYAKAVPSPIDGSNTLAVARLYADRRSYLLAAGPEMDWSSAYWCQERREIVAHLPQGGEVKLLRTLRHEGFHQYLSYAGSMLRAAPWINEGYAEYFEGDEVLAAKRVAALHEDVMADPKALRAELAAVLLLDYADFYDEDRARCARNYMLAWSIAWFLEKGAPEVRFRPFRNLTRDYMKALLRTKSGRRATAEVFNPEALDLFLDEWVKFYRDP